MKINAIRKFDKYLGIPVCFLLTLLKLLLGVFFNSNRSSNKQTEKILFIKLIEQGATVLAYSSIKNAVDEVGADNAYFLVLEENRHILDILNLLLEENIFVIKNSNFLQTALDLIKTLIRIRKLHIDTVIDMEFFSRTSAIICYLSGARKRIGNHRFKSEYSYRGDLFTHRVQYNPYIHLSFGYSLLVETAKYSNTIIPLPKINTAEILIKRLVFHPTDEEKKMVADLVSGMSPMKYKKIVILNPNSSDIIPYRKWPFEYFQQLIDLLAKNYSDTLIVLTGLKNEYSSAEKLCSETYSDQVVNLAGKLTLKELLVLYTISDILVTNDSGPGHFASLTDIDNIVMFGPETPVLFGPVSERTHVLYVKLACSPCVNVFNHRVSPCDDNVCMKEIKPQTVFEKIQEIFIQRTS